ncbi:MAG TPA: type II toxin-antitoxin system RelE/ParE family toxin [Dongiaceae bacterium]
MDVVWSRAARRDFDAIWTGIEGKSPARASKIGRLILAAAARLETLPRLGRPGRVEGTRELVIARTPYLIVYAIEVTQVSIVRVLHGAMRWPAGDDV